MKFRTHVIFLSFVIAICLLWSNHARSEGGYLGVQYAVIDIDHADFTAYNWIGGYEYNDLIGLEFRFATAMSGDSIGNADLKLDYLYGGYLKLTLPILSEFNPYVIVGHSEGRVELDYGTGKDTESRGNTSVGGGLIYHLSENWKLTGEYMKLNDESHSISIGAQLEF
jgi:opacity protein-like surface antigen